MKVEQVAIQKLQRKKTIMSNNHYFICVRLNSLIYHMRCGDHANSIFIFLSNLI